MIQVLTAIHGRRDVFAIFFAGIERLKKTHEIQLHVVASDKEDEALLKALGIDYSMYANQPLSDKFNHGVRSVLKKKWSHLLIMGSDNVLTTEGLTLAIASGKRHVGFSKCLYYELSSGSTKLFNYEAIKLSRLMGAGRLLARDVVEQGWSTVSVHCTGNWGPYTKRNTYKVSEDLCRYLVGTKCFKNMGGKVEGLWEAGLSHGLDLALETKLAQMGAAPYSLPTVALCDFKTADNLWRYDERGGTPYEAGEFLSLLSEEERGLIAKCR